MNEESKHPFDSVWLVALVMVASFVALVAMGVATSAAIAAPSAFSTRSAAEIVAVTRSAMKASGSVEAVGSGHLTLPGGGGAVAAETNYSGPTSGTQVVAMTATGSASGQALPGASISLVNGALYVNANSAFWTTSVGLTATEAPAVSDRWVEIPAASPIYGTTAADMSMPSLVKDMFDAKKFHKETVRTLHGVKVVPISYKNGGYDSGPATIYVATGGKHLPVGATISGVSLRFSGWGTTKTVSTPPGAVPLSTLLPSVSSGPPILA